MEGGVYIAIVDLVRNSSRLAVQSSLPHARKNKFCKQASKICRQQIILFIDIE
jgi:hypothetical protein